MDSTGSSLYELSFIYLAGRRCVGLASGDERFVYSNHHHYEHWEDFSSHPGTYSPRDLGMGYFSSGGNGCHQNKSQRINGKRNMSERWNARGYYESPGSNLVCVDAEELHSSSSRDTDEYKLREAAGAARRAWAIAKVKRERAERLRYKADLAIQKAAAALMFADGSMGRRHCNVNKSFKKK